MPDQFSRTRLLLKGKIEVLQSKTVAVFGIGGVGSFAVEALARAGIGQLLLIDPDVVSTSNLNRQLVALHSTLGQYKVDVAARRAKDINPLLAVKVYRHFFREWGRSAADRRGLYPGRH